MEKLETVLWNCSIKVAPDVGTETIAKPLFLTLLSHFKTFFCVTFEFIFYGGCFR